jgi:hypothetical protein
VEGQFERALNTSLKTMQMRRELAKAVVKLFDSLHTALAQIAVSRGRQPDERERSAGSSGW